MSSPVAGYDILHWDSDVFEFPVARLRDTDDRNALQTAIEAARESGVKLAYLFAKGEESAQAAISLDGQLISERVTFAREVTDDAGFAFAREDTSIVLEPWHDTSPSADLLRLARDAGSYSRFRVDPKVPKRVFNQIYDAWIINSLNKKIADEVMVIRDGSSISGLVTVGAKDGRADIGLLSVREEARGRGLGKALVRAALEWALAKGHREAQVVTQRANIPACRLYSSCGYSVESAEQVFHFWF